LSLIGFALMETSSMTLTEWITVVQMVGFPAAALGYILWQARAAAIWLGREVVKPLVGRWVMAIDAMIVGITTQSNILAKEGEKSAQMTRVLTSMAEGLEKML